MGTTTNAHEITSPFRPSSFNAEPAGDGGFAGCGQRQRRATDAPNRRRNRLEFRQGAAEQGDFRAAASQFDGDGRAERPARAGDDGLAAKSCLRHPFTQAKQALDRLKRMCIGRDLPDAGACTRFDQATKDGRDMVAVQNLLGKAVASIIGKNEERAVASLFTPGGTHAMKGEFQGSNLFEVVGIWATQTLREFVIKGFVLDDERLKLNRRFGKDYFDELLERIREIRASERRFYLKITDIDEQCSIDYDNRPCTRKCSNCSSSRCPR